MPPSSSRSVGSYQSAVSSCDHKDCGEPPGRPPMGSSYLAFWLPRASDVSVCSYSHKPTTFFTSSFCQCKVRSCQDHDIGVLVQVLDGSMNSTILTLCCLDSEPKFHHFAQSCLDRGIFGAWIFKSCVVARIHFGIGVIGLRSIVAAPHQPVVTGIVKPAPVYRHLVYPFSIHPRWPPPSLGSRQSRVFRDGVEPRRTFS
jgi:hypothetical protein